VRFGFETPSTTYADIPELLTLKFVAAAANRGATKIALAVATTDTNAAQRCLDIVPAH
jgi:hypothetical protein